MSAPGGTAGAGDRRRQAAMAGHTGDLATVLLLLGDPDEAVREAALGAVARVARAAGNEGAGARAAWEEACRTAMGDGAARVRRRLAEELAGAAALGTPDAVAEELLLALLADDDATVVEAAAWATGEHTPTLRVLGTVTPQGSGSSTRNEPEAGPVVQALRAVAEEHEDPLAREAAVAALGAIGDPSALPTILTATRDKPAIRRRAVIALAPFVDLDEAQEALARAGDDRDWQVRDAARALLED